MGLEAVYKLYCFTYFSFKCTTTLYLLTCIEIICIELTSIHTAFTTPLYLTPICNLALEGASGGQNSLPKTPFEKACLNSESLRPYIILQDHRLGLNR